MKINDIKLKYDKSFGSYFGTTKAEKYNTGKNHFKPLYRIIYISSPMYPKTKKNFYYITSSIVGKMRLYKHRTWFDTEIGNIFASGKTLKKVVKKFEHNLSNYIYNTT